jgi:hypothetical protein
VATHCPYTSQGDQLTLSSLHMGYIPHVVMPIFKISPRSCGPSWKRGRGSHTNKSWYYTKNYLIKDQVAPEHIWGLIHQGTRPRINPCFRHGYPGIHPGALDISRDLNCLVPDQEPQSSIGGPLKGLLLLGPRPRTPVIYWGPFQGSFAIALTAWSQTKNPRSVLGALVHN